MRPTRTTITTTIEEQLITIPIAYLERGEGEIERGERERVCEGGIKRERVREG